jgi:adenine-specific DNA-methyltransferase
VNCYENKLHPWSNASGKEAEKIFSTAYPAIHLWFEKSRDALIKRYDQGRFFWELRSCQYWEDFNQPKILYQEIATYQAFSLDNSASCSNNKTFLIPSADLYLLGLLNSKAVWYFLNHTASKLQGGAYAMQTPYVSQVPIPKAIASDRKFISALVQRCLDSKGQCVEQWEAEINDRVARLYGLTKAEIVQIQGDK